MKPGPPDALLFSGGLDSACAWLLLGRPEAVYVRTGARYEREEVRTAQWLLDDHLTVLDGPDVGYLAEQDGHVPHRNLLLATTAAAHGYRHLALAAVAGEASPDKTRRFLRHTSRALTTSEASPYRLSAPFLHLSKTALVRETLAAHPMMAPWLQESRSCYSAGPWPCRRCQACFRRWVALTLNDQPCGPRPAIPRPTAMAARRVGPLRWPAIARNNTTAARALWRSR